MNIFIDICNLITHFLPVTVTDYSYLNFVIRVHVTSYSPTLSAVSRWYSWCILRPVWRFPVEVNPPCPTTWRLQPLWSLCSGSASGSSAPDLKHTNIHTEYILYIFIQTSFRISLFWAECNSDTDSFVGHSEFVGYCMYCDVSTFIAVRMSHSKERMQFLLQKNLQRKTGSVFTCKQNEIQALMDDGFAKSDYIP